MKKISLIFFIGIINHIALSMEQNPCNTTMTIRSLHSSESTSEQIKKTIVTKRIDSLLKEEAKVLQHLLDIEFKGQFSPLLISAETILSSFFDTNPPQEELYKKYGKNTLYIAQSVAQRPNIRKKKIPAILENDDAISLKKIIQNNLFIINTYDFAQDTLLHKAINLEKEQCIMTLLQLKANPNCLDSQNCSALHLAVQKELSYHIIVALLQAGADPDIKNQEGNTPFDIVCDNNSANVKAFEKYGYLFFSSLWPHKNPFILLKDNAAYLKKLAEEPLDSYEWQYAVQALRTFFNHIKKHTPELPLTKCNAVVTRNNFTLCRASQDHCAELFKDMSLKRTIEDASCLMKHKQEIKNNLVVSAHRGEHEKLDDILRDHTISSTLQYEILKICISNYRDECLLACLNYKFNPNRYHNQQSLLHYAIDCNNPQAIKLLSDCNADLTIMHTPADIDLLKLEQSQKTPLDYAIQAKKIDCIKAMAAAIDNRKLALVTRGGYCGLSKHIFGKYKISGFCEECIGALSWQLHFHSEYIGSII